MAESFVSSGLKTLELNDLKSGMEGLEKDKINRVIYNASKGSSYFNHQHKRQQCIDRQIQQLLSRLERLTENRKRVARQEMDELAKMFEERRNLTRVIVHIDMDAFYAAVEMRDKPEYKDKPLAVGSLSMLSTSNYVARRFGVRAAMPGFIAKKLCPDLIIVPLDFSKYTLVSNEVREILAEYDPDFIPMSLDEAYLDITTYLRNILFVEDGCIDVYESDDDSECFFARDSSGIFNFSDAVVKEIRQKIFDKTGLTASAGIACNMMLAKICSDMNKPNGQFKVEPKVGEIKAFIKSLPVRKVSGIGPVQAQLLNALSITTCGDLWEKRELLPLLFSPICAHFYLRVSLGIGSLRVKCESSQKSKGVEVTFQEISNVNSLIEMCSNLCRELASDLQAMKLLGKVVVLKIKTTDFEVKTRNHTLPFHTSREINIFEAAKALLVAEVEAVKPEPLCLRLMGVRMTELVEEASNGSVLKQPTLTESIQKLPDIHNSCSDDESCELTFYTLSTIKKERKSKLANDCIVSNSKQMAFPESSGGIFLSSGELDDNLLTSARNTNLVRNTTSGCNLEMVQNEDYLATVSNSDCLSVVYSNHQFTSEETPKELNEGNFDEVCDEAIDLNNSSCSDSVLVCPVCMLCDSSWNLVTLNNHIDVCLNRTADSGLMANSSQLDVKKRKPNVESEKKNKQGKWET